jgi:hypothetical protein
LVGVFCGLGQSAHAGGGELQQLAQRLLKQHQIDGFGNGGNAVKLGFVSGMGQILSRDQHGRYGFVHRLSNRFNGLNPSGLFTQLIITDNQIRGAQCVVHHIDRGLN